MPRFNVSFSIALDDFLRVDGFGDGCDLITTVGLMFKSEAISALEEAFAESGAHSTFVELYEPGSHHNNQRFRFVDRKGNVHYPRLDAKVLDWQLQDLMTKRKLDLILATARGKFDKALKSQKLRLRAEEVL